MILLQGCTKVLRTPKRTTVVLNDAYLLIPPSGVTVILGYQGSGKSTLVRILAGSDRPTTGIVRRSGSVSFPIGTLGHYHRRAKARHVVLHIAEVYGVDPQLILRFLERLPGFAEILSEEMIDLPGLTRITLAYAIGYAMPFDMYLIDTNIAVGAPLFRAFCEQFFAERRRTSGIVLATSSLNTARALADRIVILDNCKLTEMPDKDEALDAFKTLVSQRTGLQSS